MQENHLNTGQVEDIQGIKQHLLDVWTKRWLIEAIRQSKLIFSLLEITIFIYKALLAGMSSKHLMDAG
jgi:hypothetical protein